MNLISDIKREEGFVGTVYKDSLGFDTVGYGTKMPIDEEEAELLLIHRLNKLKSELQARFDRVILYEEAWQVLYAMAYQLGVNGVMKFKNMVSALRAQDYNKAADEMLDSLWAKQTPARAKRLSIVMRSLKRV
jgi:lysozyme